MATFTEAEQNEKLRKRKPLRESFILAFPELTPILTTIKKNTGKRTTSEKSSEVEWPFKTFRKGRNRPVFDGDDVDFDNEAEDNEGNKDMIKGRIQLIRSAVRTGRIANAVISQHGGVEAGTKKDIHQDHIEDALRGMRTDKELILCSDADSRKQEKIGGVKIPYQMRGFASWARPGHVHADLPIPEMARMAAGQAKTIASPAAFTEDMLNSMLQSCWTVRQTNGNWKMYCEADLQTQLNQFTCFGEQTESKAPIRRFNQDADTDTISLHVRIYKGSFGQVESIPKAGLPVSRIIAGNTTNGSASITNLASTEDLSPGLLVTGTGIPANTRIAYISGATSIVLSANATATNAGTNLTFGEKVLAELWDMEFAELNYVEEVGWATLENKGGGPRGYADSISFFANLNPQAHAIIRQS